MTNFHSIDATQVTNVTLNVKDLNKLTDFYSNVLGFSIEKQTNQQTVFNIGNLGYTLTLNELNNGRQPEFREAGLFHVAYLLPTRSDLADFLYHANNLNIAMGGGDHLVSEALYFTDPEGNGIEVYHDRPSEDWVWRDGFVKMDTLEVNVNDLMAQKYHHHIATNSWQSNKIRTQNEQTYGLCHFDIYQPNANTTHVTSPEGFDITIHGNETK